MTGPAPDFDDPDDECPNCDGSGFVDSCFEDTCVCREPPCHRLRCDWCNHDGRVSRHAPPVADDESKVPAAGPLLAIMDKEGNDG